MPRARWFTALLVLAALVVPAQAQTKLQWKFVKDKPFYQEVKTTTKQDMTISNQKITQNQSQTFYFSWTPLSRDDKNKTWKVKQKIEGVKLNIEVGGTNISYDSTKGESQNNPLSDFFKQLVGSEFTLTIDDKGKIQGKIEGKDEFINKLVKNNAQMEPLLKDILSDEAFKQMADPTFAALPESAVKEQATWKRDYTLNMGPIGRYKVDNTYTYEGKDKTKKDLDKIAVKSNVTYIPPESKSTLQLPFKIEKAKLTDAGNLLL